jgi:hypothetical protein
MIFNWFMAHITSDDKTVTTAKWDDGFCDGNAKAESGEYQHQYPGWRQPSRLVGSDTLQSEGNVHSCRQHMLAMTNEMCWMNKCLMLNLHLSGHICSRPLLDFSLTYTVWGAVHLQQGLQPDDNLSLQFCQWLLHKIVDEPNFLCCVV